MDKRIKVLYIGGAGRSGSTLLEMMLSNLKGTFAIGEMVWMWDRGMEKDELCSCGQPFSKCKFWSVVFPKATKDFDQLNYDYIENLHNDVQRLRHVPHYLLTALQSPRFKESLEEYKTLLGCLYQTISEESGADYIIDSSKSPQYGFVLSQLDNIDLRVVHLIRDSRAVAYSWQRKKIRPEIHWKEQHMKQFSLRESARNWNSANIATHLLKQRADKYLFLRYEDLTKDPQGCFKQVLELIDYEDRDVSFLDENTFEANDIHTIAGNPLRFNSGGIKIKTDQEWKTALTQKQKLLVSTLTLPLLLRHGYLTN